MSRLYDSVRDFLTFISPVNAFQRMIPRHSHANYAHLNIPENTQHSPSGPDLNKIIICQKPRLRARSASASVPSFSSPSAEVPLSSPSSKAIASSCPWRHRLLPPPLRVNRDLGPHRRLPQIPSRFLCDFVPLWFGP
jgi:hypothetical protein